MTPQEHAAATRDWSIPLRPIIRETMQLQPSRKFTAKTLLKLIESEYNFASEADVNNALLWNQDKGLVDYSHNAEFDRDEWFLTERGKNKA